MISISKLLCIKCAMQQDGEINLRIHKMNG